MYDYPPEFDGPDHCLVCGKDISRHDTECVCPECPVCTEVGEPNCYNVGHMEKGNRAFNLQELAEHLSCERVDQISKRLFKATACGISFWVDGTQVGISGYAEGSGDAECPAHIFNFPLDLDKFDKAIILADQEGCDLFDQYHCAECGNEIDYEETCEECVHTPTEGIKCPPN